VAPRDLVVSLETAAAARAGGVLGDEHRVTAVRRLAPVLVGQRRRDSPCDQIRGVPADRLQAAELDERAFTATQVKARAERLLGKDVEPFVDCFDG
jgi:hypothetical protein